MAHPAPGAPLVVSTLMAHRLSGAPLVSIPSIALFLVVRAPCLVSPRVALRCPSSAIWSLSMGKKIISKLSRRDPAATRRNLGRTNLGLRAQLFCRGHFPPGGGNHHHRHHQRSSHRERTISINIFTSTISSPNPSSSLVSKSCRQVWDWC